MVLRLGRGSSGRTGGQEQKDDGYGTDESFHNEHIIPKIGTMASVFGERRCDIAGGRRDDESYQADDCPFHTARLMAFR